MEWLSQFWESLTWSRIIWGSLITVVSVIVSYAGIVIGMVKIPADYFSSAYVANHSADKRFFVRWSGLIIKNTIGLFLVLAGIVMIFTPGPGVPTILLGLIMMDIPGKRPLETNLVKRPAVLSAINSLRARYRKPPLIMD